MAIYLIVALALLFLILGFVYLAKGLKGVPEKEEVIPITDINEIKETAGTNDVHQSESSNTETAEALGHPDQGQSADGPNGPFNDNNLDYQELENARKEIERLKKENNDLSAALNREMSVTDTKTLSEEEKKLLEEKDKQIFNLNHAVEGYLKEIRNLKAKQEEFRQIISSTNEETKDIELLKQEKDELNMLIDKLRNDIELNNSEIAGQRSIYEDEKQELLLKINEYEKKIAEGKGLIDNLNEQVAVLKDSQFEPNSKEVSEKLMGAEELKSMNQQLIKEIEDLKLKVKDVQEHNIFLAQKEEALKKELTKSMAQSLGFERICRDFKDKIEKGTK